MAFIPQVIDLGISKLVRTFQFSQPAFSHFEPEPLLNSGGDKGKVFFADSYGEVFRLFFFCGGCVKELVSVLIVLGVILIVLALVTALLLVTWRGTVSSVR